MTFGYFPENSPEPSSPSTCFNKHLEKYNIQIIDQDNNTNQFQFLNRTLTLVTSEPQTVNPENSNNNQDKKNKTIKKNKEVKVPDTVAILAAMDKAITFDGRYTLKNPKRRDEVYFPLMINNVHIAHVNFWQDNNLKFPNSIKSFNYFHTVGCMFGSNLKGETKLGNKLILIDHHLTFSKDDFINKIVHEEGHNLYEAVLYQQLERYRTIMLSLSDKTEQIHLTHHLPSGDYILSMIKLYLYGQMTFNALDQVINLILAKEKDQKAEILAIFEAHNRKDIKINVNFVSPFNILFDKNDKTEYEGNFTRKILNSLGLETPKIPKTNVENLDLALPPLDPKNDTHETVFISKCIKKLSGQGCEQIHDIHRAWGVFLPVLTKSATIEDLLALGNTVVVYLSTENNKHYSCSILPLSEKQIQICYGKNCKAVNIENYVYDLTCLDNIIGDPKQHGGTVFYYDAENKTQIASLLNNKKLSSRQNIITPHQDIVNIANQNKITIFNDYYVPADEDDYKDNNGNNDHNQLKKADVHNLYHTSLDHNNNKNNKENNNDNANVIELKVVSNKKTKTPVTPPNRKTKREHEKFSFSWQHFTSSSLFGQGNQKNKRHQKSFSGGDVVTVFKSTTPKIIQKFQK